MSTTIAAVLINLLATLLPFIGVNAGSEQLTTTVQTLVAIGTGIYIWYRRTKMVAVSSGNGDVTAAGIKK